MGLLSPILRNGEGGRLIWRCPGCKAAHEVRATIRQPVVHVPPDPSDPEHNPDWPPPREYYEARDGAWTWNGSATHPTFTPSVLIRTYVYPHPYEPDRNPEHAEIRKAFQTPGVDGHAWMMGHPKWGRCCHSFVADGQMKFLSDSTHALAGQAVPIPPWPQTVTP